MQPEFQEFLIEQVLEPFYLKRLESLRALRLESVLKRKNPYLFKAKNLELSGELARSIVDAFLSSQEETIFGNLLESFAVHIARTLYGGFKSPLRSLDLEFVRDQKLYLVGIKSGTSWGNSDQIAAMKTNFKAAKIQRRGQGFDGEIIAINGCMYGRERSPLKTDADPDKTYFKLAGQAFWEFLTEDSQFYREIIEPLDREAGQKDAAFRRAYAAKINELTRDLSLNFVSDGQIDWPKLVDFVSAHKTTKLDFSPSSEAAIEIAQSQIAAPPKRSI